MAVSVRHATAADAASLHELAAATFLLACPPGTPKEASDAFVAEHLSQDKFAAYAADPARVVMVASDDAVFVGYTMTIFAESTDPDVLAALTVSPSAELSKFYVRAEQHGAGVSAALMEATVAAVADRGYPAVWLGVNQFNPRANRFYEKNGFLQVGVKRFLLAGNWEDDFVRERVLKA